MLSRVHRAVYPMHALRAMSLGIRSLQPYLTGTISFAMRQWPEKTG